MRLGLGDEQVCNRSTRSTDAGVVRCAHSWGIPKARVVESHPTYEIDGVCVPAIDGPLSVSLELYLAHETAPPLAIVPSVELLLPSGREVQESEGG